MKKYLDYIFAGVIAATAFQFYYTWVERLGASYLRDVVYSQDGLPFVYRLLIPALSRGLSWITNIDVVYCMIFLFVLSAVGLYASLKYLYATFRQDDRAGMVAFISCEIFFLIMLHEPHIYDPATGMFFSLSFALLARRKFSLYYLLFPLATLNRETTFLLLLFFAVYFYNKIPLRTYLSGLVYQGFVYISLKVLVMAAFAGADGVPFVFRPAGVIHGYLDKPAPSLLLLCAFALVAWLVLRGWNSKPVFLRVALITIFPVVLALHLMVGHAFEIRVLLEAAPVVLVTIHLTHKVHNS